MTAATELAAALGGTTRPGLGATATVVDIACVVCGMRVCLNIADYPEMWTEQTARTALTNTYDMVVTDGGWSCKKHLMERGVA